MITRLQVLNADGSDILYIFKILGEKYANILLISNKIYFIP